MALTNKKVIRVSIIVDLIDIVTNFLVFFITNSTVMLSEGLMGVVDLTSLILLNVGEKKTHQKATKTHPFGYGREIYFWSSMASFVMLAITAVITFIAGWRQFQNPQELEQLFWAMLVLIIAIFTNGYAFKISIDKLMDDKRFKNSTEAFANSTQIIPKTTIVLDLIGLIAAVIGLVAIILADITGNHRLDGIGSMAMALILASMSIVLLKNIRDLIVGQSLDEPTLIKIKQAVIASLDVDQIVDIKTMVLGTDASLINIEIVFKNGRVEESIAKLKEEIAQIVGGKSYIYIEPK